VVLENYGPEEHPELWRSCPEDEDNDTDLKYILDAAIAEGILDGDGILAMMRAVAQ
jgi:hypothetical protein